MTKKVILIVITIILYLTLWSVAYFFAYSASVPYRDNSYFNEEVFKLYREPKNDEKFLARYLGTKNAFTSKDKIYNIKLENKDEINELSLSIYPIFFTNKKVGVFLYIDKFLYNGKNNIIDLNYRTRTDPGYEKYKKDTLVPVYIQFRYKGKTEYTNPIILDPFRINYFLKGENELEAFRLLKEPKFSNKNLLVSFTTFKNDLDPRSIEINKRLLPNFELEKKGWPDNQTIQKYNLLVEKPNYSNYSSTLKKVMLGMSLLFIIVTYLLFFHRILLNKIRYRYRGKTQI